MQIGADVGFAPERDPTADIARGPLSGTFCREHAQQIHMSHGYLGSLPERLP